MVYCESVQGDPATPGRHAPHPFPGAEKDMPLSPAMTKPAVRAARAARFVGLCAACAAPAALAADVELLVDLGAGGALSLRSDTGSVFDINAYSIFSSAGLLSDTGDETLGGLVSPVFFDVDNAGSDEVALWTIGPNGENNPDLALPIPTGALALNLAWIGGPTDDAVADLIVEYGLPGTGTPVFGTADVVVLQGGITGDYNASGQVEQGDLDLVLQNWGDVTPPVPTGWVNDLPVGQIEQTELDKVLQNWGSTSAPDFSGSAVPEPAMTAAFGILGGLVLRRRPKKSSRFL